jgi:hypothetical protein
MKLRLKGGDKLTHKGIEYLVRKTSSLNASPVLGTAEEDNKEELLEEAVKGNHQSDLPDPVDRAKVVELIKDYLAKIEDHQSELLHQEAFRDDELEVSPQIGEHYKASIYAASVVYISELETLIENLGKL